MFDLTVNHFVPARQSIGRATLLRPMEALRIAWRTYLTRQALPDLTARELADIGVSRMTALAEAARLPWDTTPPQRRQRRGSIAASIQQALERARTRRLLARMQAREVRDVGIGPSEADYEASKPFWRG